MTTLIIARHGNTFEKGQTPTRVGARTDLPLVESGRVQAKAIGQWLKQNGLYPEAVYSSQLKRTIETAEIALKEAGYKEPVFPLEIFNEIDYGPDENLPEDAVKERVGEQALKDWDEKAIVPDGWIFDPEQTIKNWKNFADHIISEEQNCIMVVTSNGIARFAPYITGDFDNFADKNTIKISTGAVCVLQFDNGRWAIKDWNIKPQC
jgi:2,3-bisphosphoglycerate-dependent phosphoglycerate mutase